MKAFNGATMGEYRAYVIGADGHIQLRVDLVVPDETTARNRAKHLVDGHAVELWEGATRIERFEPKTVKGACFAVSRSSRNQQT
jgi:hypothetical protein